jgi:ferredoxin
MIKKAHLIYFSPTGTTKKIVESVGRGLGAEEISYYDLTLPTQSYDTVLTEGVAIIGIPVYAGRVPALCLTRMAQITSTALPTILVALYGNREFEDALVELRDLSCDQGFQVIAAGAFIGEHSYSTPENPIARNRPDPEDLKIAVNFGQQIALKIASGTLVTPAISGNVPYKESVKLGGIAPDTTLENCTLCGSCAMVCPTGVVTVNGSVVTNAANCVMCCACVKACEFTARTLNHPMIEERRAMLIKHCSLAKAPTLFL